jgi:hypothetical protein
LKTETPNSTNRKKKNKKKVKLSNENKADDNTLPSPHPNKFGGLFSDSERISPASPIQTSDIEITLENEPHDKFDTEKPVLSLLNTRAKVLGTRVLQVTPPKSQSNADEKISPSTRFSTRRAIQGASLNQNRQHSKNINRASETMSKGSIQSRIQSFVNATAKKEITNDDDNLSNDSDLRTPNSPTKSSKSSRSIRTLRIQNKTKQSNTIISISGLAEGSTATAGSRYHFQFLYVLIISYF